RMGRRRPHRGGPAITRYEPVVGLPALQAALVDAGDLTGLFQPRAGLLGRFDVLGQRLAIFEPDHSSSPLSLLKIAETFFDNTSNAAVSARALSLRRSSRSSSLMRR